MASGELILLGFHIGGFGDDHLQYSCHSGGKTLCLHEAGENTLGYSTSVINVEFCFQVCTTVRDQVFCYMVI